MFLFHWLTTKINACTIIILPYLRHGSLFTVRGIIKKMGVSVGQVEMDVLELSKVVYSSEEDFKLEY